jgi:RNA polymerase sigma factor (sigma-70 family)
MVVHVACRCGPHELFVSWFPAGFGPSAKKGSKVSASGTGNHESASRVDAAARIVAEHGDFIRSVIRYHAKSNSQAEELFQDFFLSLVNKPLPDDVRDIKRYLYRMITNDFLDAARRVERYQNHVSEYSRRVMCPVNERTPGDAIIEAEEMDKMFKFIESQLKRREARAVSLRYRNNYEIGQIAEDMNVDKRTVSRYISAGLSKIRQMLTAKTREFK